MATGYIASNKIEAFPAIKRSSTYQKDARLMTEESITRVFKYMYNQGVQSYQDGFVITTDPTSATFDFVIGGYYMSVDMTAFKQMITNSGVSAGVVLAGITINTTDGYKELSMGDDNGEFKGVQFEMTTGTPSITGTYKLALCSFVVSSGNVILALGRNLPLIDGGDEQ